MTDRGKTKRIREPRCLQYQGHWWEHLRKADPNMGINDVVPDIDESNARRSSRQSVFALVRLRPCATWKITLPLDWAMLAQWMYYGQSLDAFFVSVEHVWLLEQPVEATLKHRITCRQGITTRQFCAPAVPIALARESLFVNYDTLSIADLVASDGSVVVARELAQSFGLDIEGGDVIPTLQLVEPLSRLLQHRSLPSLLLLSRWKGASQLWEGWPDPQWCQATADKQYVPGTPANASALKLLSQDLRMWTDRIVGRQCEQDDQDDDGPCADLQILESHLQMLDALTADLVGGATAASWHDKKHHYSGDVILSSVIASRELRSTADFGHPLLQQFCKVLPPSLRELTSEAFASKKVQLPSMDSRFTLIVDVALMLHRRRSNTASLCAARYAFADTSTQAVADWLLCKVRTIRAENINQVFEVAASLTNDADMLDFEEEATDMWDEPELAHRKVDRAALYDKLQKHIDVQTLPPLAQRPRPHFIV